MEPTLWWGYDRGYTVRLRGDVRIVFRFRVRVRVRVTLRDKGRASRVMVQSDGCTRSAWGWGCTGVVLLVVGVLMAVGVFVTVRVLVALGFSCWWL